MSMMILTLGIAGAAICANDSELVDAAGTVCHVPMRAVTAGPKAHWFGYYDKQQFDATGRYMLGMEVGFQGRTPEPGDVIHLGYIDLEQHDRWTPFAESRAWNWQQGCMLQWLPGSKAEVIYNEREGDRYVAVVQDGFTGQKRKLPKPIYAVTPDGRYAIGTNFSRITETRPGYGYAGVPDPYVEYMHPAEDGL